MLKRYQSMFNLEHTIAKDLFNRVDNPWDVLPLIKNYIYDLIKTLDDEYIKIGEDVFIHKTVKYSNNSTIIGPTIIGKNTEVRPGAYIRGNAIIGEGCVIGNSSEIKNAIIFDGAQCPHFNYVGDSILGYKAHTGAGVILSNLKSDKSNVNVDIDGKKESTNLKKFGAIIGDNAEIGCNSVLCPGSIIFENSNVYPLVRFRGTLPANMICKDTSEIIAKRENKQERDVNMSRLFGTDGIRGIANKDLTLDLAYKVGQAASYVLGKNNDDLKVIIGRDTRISGSDLSSSIVSGLMYNGAKIVDVGIIPTPGISYLVKALGFTMGVMITASHNPSEYNGIKIFDENGFKLPDEVEDEIEKCIVENKTYIQKNKQSEYHFVPGVKADSIKEQYISTLSKFVSIDSYKHKIIVDCANGSASETAPALFSKFDLDVEFINTDYDGRNINDNCGSTKMQSLIDTVKTKGASLGIAYDGDADRCLMVDEDGTIVSGDQIIAILSDYMKSNNELDNNTIVGTVMSNLGLKKYCQEKGINFVETKVGDRYVLESMLENDFVIGGEQSGHVILKKFLNTGAGELTSLKVIEALAITNRTLKEYSQIMKIYPQVLINVEVSPEGKKAYESDLEFSALLNQLSDKLQDEGRILVRASGTENLIRVMVEGKDDDIINEYAEMLASYLRKNYSNGDISRIRK